MCYRISHQGNGTCNLSPKIPPRSGTLVEDPDYDVYVKKQECRYVEPTPPSYPSVPKPADCKYHNSIRINDSGACKAPLDPAILMASPQTYRIIEFFVGYFGLNSFLLASTQPLKEMIARGVFCGGKGDRCIRLTTLPFPRACCLEFLGAYRGTVFSHYSAEGSILDSSYCEIRGVGSLVTSRGPLMSRGEPRSVVYLTEF